MQWHGRGRGVDEPAVQLRGAGRAIATTNGPCTRSGFEPGDAAAGELDTRLGHDGHAVPREAGPHREVEGVVDDREGRVESAEGAPDGVAHEDRSGVEAEHVAQAVVLPLIELVVDERDASPQSRHRAAEARDAIGFVPFAQLGSGDRDRLRGLEGGDERRERVGRRRAVFGEQPQRVGIGCRFVEDPVGGADRLAEREALRQLDDVGGRRGRDLLARVGVGLGQHRDEGVGTARLGVERGERSSKVVAAPVHDEYGGDSGEHRGQPKRLAPRHPSLDRARLETRDES